MGFHWDYEAVGIWRSFIGNRADVWMQELKKVGDMDKKSEIKSFIGEKVRMLQAMSETGEGKAQMANLRRGAGHEPGELPQLFGTILLDMPQEFMSEEGMPTKEEWACYIALTLYAVHQQGFSPKGRPMHTSERTSIGRAMAQMAKRCADANGEKRSMQKLQSFATALDMKEASHHLRNIIRLLGRDGIPVNYEILAADLYEFQYADGKSRVNLRWGQDFYMERERKGKKSVEEE